MTAVRRLTREYGIKGVHGALIELLACDEQMHTAVEVIAGNMLFHAAHNPGVADADKLMAPRRSSRGKRRRRK